MMVALGVLVPIEAKALPFNPTPEEFIEYLNSGTVKWRDNSENYFYNPRNCALIRGITGDEIFKYKCDMDFDITSSLGKKTCINYTIEYWTGSNSVDKQSYSSSAECSKWENISATQEPQSAPTTQEPSQPIPPIPTTTTNTTLDNNLILAGGAGIFVAGGLLGVAFSQLLGGRKKN